MFARVVFVVFGILVGGNKSSVLAGIPTHNTMASKPVIGNPALVKAIPGTPPSSPKSSTSTKSPAVNINPGMAGQCKPGVVHKEVTLKGGINAGTYKDIGTLPTIEECSKKCCSYAPCDLAFMLQGRCYLVGCTDGKSCQLQKAKKSPYQPSVMYVTRWNNEGVKHTINVQDDISSNFMCSPMKLMKKVTLKGGLKSGDFTDTGKVGNIGECYDLCCQQPTCNLAFMLGQNCFSVKCFNKDLCSTIPAQPSIYNPQIAYVYNRKIVQPKDKGKQQQASKKTEIIKPAPKCPVGKVLERVTLVGGLNAGNFHDNGKVKDIQQCRRICCEMPKCNLAFMLGINCFSVECKNAALCKTQPAQPSQFFPKISYVRPFGSSEFMASGDFTKLSMASTPETKSPVPGLPGAPSKPVVPGLPNDKPAIPGLSDSKANIPGLPDSKPSISGLPDSKPVIPGLQDSKPAIQGLPDSKPVIPGLPNSKPVIPGLPDSKPVIPGLPDSKPVMPGLSDSKTGIAALSATSKPAMPAPANSNQLLQQSLAGQPNAPQEPGLQQSPVSGLGGAQGLEAALGKSSTAAPSIGTNLNGVPGQPQLPGAADSSQNTLEGGLLSGNPLADLAGGSQTPGVHPTPVSKTTQVTASQTPSTAGQATQSPSSLPEKKTEIPKTPDDASKKVNLTNTISEAKPGQAMTMKIIDGKLQLSPVDAKEKETPKKNATASVGAFDAILGGDDDTSDKCMGAKIVTDVTLKGGKKAGKFKDQGDVKDMKECKKLCCDDDKCNLAFMLEKTCYTVTCKSKILCEHTPAPPSDFRPRISYVRPLSEAKDLPAIPKAPEHLRCKYSNITNNKQFQGPMGADNFTIQHDATSMPQCMARCCQDKKCDIAYFIGDKCYSVKCSSKDACKPVPIGDKPKDKIPLISAMVMKPKDEPDFMSADFEGKSSSSPEVTDLQTTSKERCHSNRISSGVTLSKNNQGSNFTNMGIVGSLKKCIALCCVRPACDIAYLHDNNCFSVHCNDGFMCQSDARPAEAGVNVKMAYMDRKNEPAKERDWMLVYMIVGALAFAAVVGGVIWGVCLCTKRNKIGKQRRLLDDDDEDDEMLPKPTQTRYRTPMHRY